MSTSTKSFSSHPPFISSEWFSLSVGTAWHMPYGILQACTLHHVLGYCLGWTMVSHGQLRSGEIYLRSCLCAFSNVGWRITRWTGLFTSQCLVEMSLLFLKALMPIFTDDVRLISPIIPAVNWKFHFENQGKFFVFERCVSIQDKSTPQSTVEVDRHRLKSDSSGWDQKILV